VTTTLKLDWDENVIDLVTKAISEELVGLWDQSAGNEDDIGALTQAMADIQGYRAMVEAVKTGDPDNRITDATTLRMAAAVLRRRWRGRAAELLETQANDLHPLP
jgi:hypothetical protein